MGVWGHAALSAWKEPGAWLVGGIGGTTDALESATKFVAMQGIGGAILVCMHHAGGVGSFEWGCSKGRMKAMGLGNAHVYLHALGLGLYIRLLAASALSTTYRAQMAMWHVHIAYCICHVHIALLICYLQATRAKSWDVRCQASSF
jgi:hypothetical protein